MALARRAQAEVTSTVDSKVVILPSRIDHHPVAINKSLGVRHPRFWATKRPIIPSRRLCTHDHQFVAGDFGQFGGLV
jgi:hypothetical protein